MAQFNRLVSVLIGPAGAESAIKVDELRVTFKIKKTSKADSNSCEIQIFNLSKNVREQLKETGFVLILKAGYKDGAGLEDIYKGTITIIDHEHSGPDMITKFECGDKELQETKFNASYKEGTSLKTILADIVKAFPLSSKVVESVKDGQQTNGMAFSGLAKDVLDKITKSLGLNWSIQDRALQIIEPGKPNQDEVVFITPETGLIGSPQRFEDKGKKENAADNRPAWKVKSLLIPRISVGNVVSIESAEIKKNSFFVVNSIEHSGDTHGTDWTTDMEVFERK